MSPKQQSTQSEFQIFVESHDHNKVKAALKTCNLQDRCNYSNIMRKIHNLLVATVATIITVLPNSVSSWRIEKGGAITTKPQSSSGSSHLHEQQLLELWQNERQTPPNTNSPDYFYPTATGGHAQQNGNDGAAIFVAHVHTYTPSTEFESVTVPPMELRAQYFLQENIVQEYIVPGDGRRKPYEQEVTIKIWGGGGGGCDGGEY